MALKEEARRPFEVEADGEQLLAEVGARLPAALEEGEMRLVLRVVDPEVLAELRRRDDGPDRERYALSALRLGVLALRAAGGQIDACAVREAGGAVVAELQASLRAHAQELAGVIVQYFQPETGAFPQRVAALVRPDGELERLLRAQVGGDDSPLARTLVAHVGERSALFRMLSPTEAGGLKMQLEQAVRLALEEQRARLLKEFSLDNPDSALSRLVRQVEAAKQQITAEFSSDNDRSALNRMAGMLRETREQIGKCLTLDDDHSPLALLQRQMSKMLGDLAARQQAFQEKVTEKLSALDARRTAEGVSTQHGVKFEEAVGRQLAERATGSGDLYEHVGATPGLIKNNRTGDHQVTLGAESAAPGALIVWEAKEDKSYTLAKARAEIDEARRNRGAQVGVFVFSKSVAPGDLVGGFSRHGQDLFIAWDAENPATDLLLDAAWSVARALVVARKREGAGMGEALVKVERAARAVERQIGHLDDVRKSAESIKSGADKIAERARLMADELRRQVDALDAQIDALKLEPTENT
ncbi:MAG: hypothetical protein HY719_17775 [Planctomycetes bacterium]|nr:hypothetical protein [Planctomycetota bacterium]